MDAALNPKARPTARERCASAFSSEALRIFLGVVLGGATINMDGTAIGYPIAVTFIAIVQGTWSAAALNAGDVVVVCIVSALCSMGAAPIPSAGAVLLVVILETCQVPAGFGFALILAVDWLYDRPETMVNVAGDSFAAVLAQLRHGDDLPAEAAEDPPPKAREST